MTIDDKKLIAESACKAGYDGFLDGEHRDSATTYNSWAHFSIDQKTRS
jgi:hypothetical protein